jgi:competence protein ComEA
VYERSGCGVEEEIRRLGYKVVYVPHEVIEDYNACYRVRYKGKLIFPSAADKLGIPLNEIWISEKWKKFKNYILYHELQEIKHRAEGHSGEQAHTMAIRDSERKFRGKPKHERLRREINIASKETLTNLLGINEDLYQKIVRNRPYHNINELIEKIPSLDEKLFEKIKEQLWCIS